MAYGKRAYWIHDTRESEGSVSGVFYLPSCTCSNCSYHSTMEKKICPSCRAQMGPQPSEAAKKASD